MSMKDKTIRIYDWANNDLYIGPYDDNEVDRVLDANRCSTCVDSPVCKECDGTGYSGDFEVRWIDEQNDNDNLNVYEYINY